LKKAEAKVKNDQTLEESYIVVEVRRKGDEKISQTPKRMRQSRTNSETKEDDLTLSSVYKIDTSKFTRKTIENVISPILSPTKTRNESNKEDMGNVIFNDIGECENHGKQQVQAKEFNTHVSEAGAREPTSLDKAENSQNVQGIDSALTKSVNTSSKPSTILPPSVSSSSSQPIYQDVDSNVLDGLMRHVNGDIFNSHLPHSSQTKQVIIQTSQKFYQTNPPPPPPPSPKWRPNSLLSYIHRWAAHVVK